MNCTPSSSSSSSVSSAPSICSQNPNYWMAYLIWSLDPAKAPVLNQVYDFSTFGFNPVTFQNVISPFTVMLQYCDSDHDFQTVFTPARGTLKFTKLNTEKREKVSAEFTNLEFEDLFSTATPKPVLMKISGSFTDVEIFKPKTCADQTP